MRAYASMTPRQRDRHDRILACTRQQVAQLGYDGVNMRDLAAAADVSTRTLYNLYESKDKLILAASQELLEEIGQQVGDQAGFDRLVSRLGATADTIISNFTYADAMGRMLFTAEPNAPIVHEMIGDGCEQTKTELQAMQDDGDLVGGVDKDVLARNIVGAMWSSNLMLMKGFVALHEFRAQYVGAVTGVLLPWLTDKAALRCRTLSRVAK